MELAKQYILPDLTWQTFGLDDMLESLKSPPGQLHRGRAETPREATRVWLTGPGPPGGFDRGV